MRRTVFRLSVFFFLAFSLAPAEVRRLTILHTNDLHAKMLPLTNEPGGFARLAAAIRRERAGCDHCILLDAGDVVQGSPVSTIFRGLPIFEALNRFGIDAGTLGNHDFDYGWQMTRRYLQEAHYPIVSSNVVDGSGKLFTRPYVILNVNGLRIAVVGAMTASLPSLSTPDRIGPWRALPVVETVRKYASELKDRADLIVLAGHLVAAEEDQALQSLAAVSVIVSGHAHNGIPAPSIAGGRFLVRLRSYAQELGRLDLQVDTGAKKIVAMKWTRIAIDSSLSPEADVAEIVARWEAKVSRVVDVPIATARHAFTQADLKPIMEQAMIETMKADLAFMNPGGIRDRIPEGTVLARHVWNVMPFDNRLVVGRIKGRDLPPAVKFGRNIDPDRIYRLAITDFVAQNQGEMGGKGLVFDEKGPVLRDALIDWIRKQKVLR